MVDGWLLGSGNQSKTEGRVEWLDPKNYVVKKIVVAGQTSRRITYTHEGMAYRDGRLYLLPEDGRSRLFVFMQN